MGDRSHIQWTHATWNPTRGCSLVSPGCANCYAMKQARRMDHPGGAYEGLTNNGTPVVWNGVVREIESALDQPLRWRKPRRIFVNSMSDLFHESVSDDFIDKVFAVMALAGHHTFQILTKRPGRMRRYFEYEFRWVMIEGATQKLYFDRTGEDPCMWLSVKLPLPNVHLGVSVEDQKRAEERIPLLLQTPAAVRFLSCEPLLGPLSFSPLRVRDEKYGLDRAASIYALRGSYQIPDCHFTEDHPALDWVIAGGESGPRARPCEVDWIRDIIEQCREASVPCFVKQLGSRIHATEVVLEDWGPAMRCTGAGGVPDMREIMLKHRKGGDIEEWPEALRIRQFPQSSP